MLRSIRTFSAGAILIVAATACGGGAQNSVPSLPQAAGQAPGKTASASVTITIPKKTASSAARTPKYLTSSVQGISFSVQTTANVNAYGGYVFYALTPSSTYCTTVPAGLTCTLQLQAYPGPDIITVQTWDGTNPTLSNIISATTLSVTINPLTNNVLNFITNAVVAQLVTAIGTPTNGSSPFTAPVTWTAYDGDGRVIVGPYDAPLSLVDHDTTGATSVHTSDGAGNLNGSASTATFTYTASAAPTTLDLQTLSINSSNYTPYSPVDAQLQWTSQGTPAVNTGIQSIAWSTATAAGYGNAGNAWNVPSGPEPAFPAQSLPVSGGTGPYTVTAGATGCSGSITTGGTTPAFTVAPVMGSSSMPPGCTLTVTDSASHSANVIATVHN